MNFKNIIASTLLLTLLGCAMTPKAIEGIPSITDSDFSQVSDKKTRTVETYSGLQNQLNVSATKLDSEMSRALLAKTAQVYEWNSSSYNQELEKVRNNLLSKTEYFVSFYTPERKQDNLNSSKTIWKIYLDVGGQRYEGKATKLKTQFADLQALYPRYNRFSTPYKIEFPVATTVTENLEQTLTITGPAATAKLSF